MDEGVGRRMDGRTDGRTGLKIKSQFFVEEAEIIILVQDSTLYGISVNDPKTMQIVL